MSLSSLIKFFLSEEHKFLRTSNNDNIPEIIKIVITIDIIIFIFLSLFRKFAN
jgi:hypothetical protein